MTDEKASAATASPADATRRGFGLDGADEDWLDRCRMALMQPTPVRLGEYQLLLEAGRGTQGSVYKAVQPRTGRIVAIKRLAAGRFVTPGMLARFEREVRALAALNHPGVVTVFEADEVDGQPVLLMEWIDGVAIDQWAAGRALRDRLLAFALICDAVHHAHQRGVIHRDLKPSNILVDASGRPHVLDFGLAKLLEDEALESTGPAAGAGAPGLGGRTTTFVGTPAYAAPEQVRGGAAAVDTRTDVYALGAILYELLTGAPALPRSPDLARMLDAVCRDEPHRPSSLVKSLGAELDAIALKSLAKEPERRYQSVEALGADIRRYLAGETVLAHPPSRAYRARKFVRRHRAAVGACVLVLVGLIAFGAYAAVQSRRYASLAVEEHAARLAADAARLEADAGRDRADRESARAASVTDFLLETLALADPDVTQVRDMSVRTLLDLAADEIASSLDRQPEVRAEVHAAIGRAYASLGILADAEYHLGRALRMLDAAPGADPRAVYEALWPYTLVLTELSDVTAEAHWHRLGAMPAALLAGEHPELADAIHALADPKDADDDAESRRLERLLAAAQSALAPDDPAWLLIADALFLHGAAPPRPAQLDQAQRRLLEALAILERRLPATHSRVLRTRAAIISISLAARRFTEAETTTRETLDLLSGALPADHWMIAAFESHLGRCLAGQMRFEEAEAIMRPALGRILEACDWTHRSVLPTLIALIDVYEALGRTDRAAQHRLLLAGALNRLHQTASIANAEKAFGPEYQALWSAMRDFDRAVAAGSDSAPEQLQRVFSLRRQSLPDDHDLSALFADVMCPLLNKFWGRRGFDAHSSLAAFRELLTIARASPHLHPYKRASAAYWVSYNLEMTGDHQEGEAIAREALLLLRDRRDKSFGRGGPVSSLLGRHLVGQARYEEAEPWLVEGYELLLQAPGPQDWNTWVAWERLVQLYTTWGQNSERLTPRLQHLLDSKPAVAPNLLDVWAWHVLIHPNLERSVYATALDAIRRADRLVPDNVHFIKTLGMAHYRVGDYETALSHMRRADELRQAQLPGGIPEDVAFIAMSLFQLGRADEARAAHARMSALLADDRPDHRVAPQLGAEADRLLAAPANR